MILRSLILAHIDQGGARFSKYHKIMQNSIIVSDWFIPRFEVVWQPLRTLEKFRRVQKLLVIHKNMSAKY